MSGPAGAPWTLPLVTFFFEQPMAWTLPLVTNRFKNKILVIVAGYNYGVVLSSLVVAFLRSAAWKATNTTGFAF